MIGVYKKCCGFLRESKVYFLIISILFLFSILIGCIFPIFFVELIAEFIKKIFEQTAGMDFWQLLIFILQNNIMTAFIGMMLGVLIGVFPIINTMMNGYVVGFVMNKAAEVGGAVVMWRLIPHGLFEIPALIISLGLGLRLGMFIFAKNKKKDFIYALENSFRVFLFVVIPLLLIAGLVETALIFFIG